MTARRYGVGLLLAALVGCAGEAGDPGAPPAPIEGEEDIEAAWCEAMVRCDVYPDLDACLAAIDVVGEDLRTAFEAGHASYDPNAAAACHTALEQVSCEELAISPDLADCDVWDGTVPDGGDCGTGAECAGAYCDQGDCDPALSCCVGTCAAEELDPGVPIAGDCSAAACVADAWCDEAVVPATCRALVAADQPCAEGQCQVDLYCHVTDALAGTGVCAALPVEGDACDPDYPVCARADNWCDPADNRCHKLAAVGEACDETSDNCVAYAWCAPGGRCQAMPGEGEPCLDWPPCLGDLECLDDTCVMPPAENEAEDCD